MSEKELQLEYALESWDRQSRAFCLYTAVLVDDDVRLELGIHPDASLMVRKAGR